MAYVTHYTGDNYYHDLYVIRDERKLSQIGNIFNCKLALQGYFASGARRLYSNAKFANSVEIDAWVADQITAALAQTEP